MGRFRVALVVFCLLVLSSARAFAIDFIVTKTADTADGSCNADCSLREAIIAANTAPGADRIILGSGLTYTLTLGPADPPGAPLTAGSGDLDIVDSVTIDGNGSTIDALGLDRVFDIQGNILVTINSLTITGGSASGFLSLGGGINIRFAAVVLNNCIVNGNSTAVDVSGNRDNGGGISVVGSYSAVAGMTTLAALTLNNTSVGGNTGLNGGGIFCALCALTVTNSAVSGNVADGSDGGGIDVVGHASTVSLNRSTLSNTVTSAAGRGGGLSVPFGTSISTLSRNRITSNGATTGRAIFSSVGTVTATNNWWGCNFGPGTGGAGCIGTPNGVSGPVTAAPYLVLKTYMSPPAIVPNASATAAADLTFNSVNADTSAGGTVPNGIVAAFSGTLGTFATPTATTTNAKAADVYTNGGATGSASISAVVDGQTATTTLLVAFGLPTVVTGAAGGIGAFGATLNGTANPNGSATTANFEYGQTILYGSTTPVVSLGSGGAPVSIGSGALTGLACNTSYHFRAAAANGSGTTSGLDATFTTTACPPPTVVTGLASAITRTGATLNGTANPNGAATTGNFEYGLTANYGNTTPVQSLGSGNVAVSIGGGVVAGLVCNTQYHFRAVAANPSVTTNGSDATFTTPACGADFDGDHRSDVLWRNKATGQNIGWLMNGLTVSTASFLPTIADGNWEIKGTGDFDRDGKADIIWRNKANGQNIGWLMNGLTAATSAFLPTIADTNWQMKGVGDLDGDGKADVVLRHRVSGQNIGWLVNGLTVSTSAFLPTIADTNWEIVGVGDLDGDGKTDVIWRNKVTGQDIGWLMNGLTVATSAFLPTIADTNWEIKGAGDVNGDGKADVVWRNKVSGQTIGWLMNGLTVATSAFLPTIADTNWEIKGVGDFDGDGKFDVVWRNKVSGQNIGWLMNGLTVASSAFLPTIADTNWEIVGP